MDSVNVNDHEKLHGCFATIKIFTQIYPYFPRTTLYITMQTSSLAVSCRVINWSARFTYGEI